MALKTSELVAALGITPIIFLYGNMSTLLLGSARFYWVLQNLIEMSVENSAAAPTYG
jgi:hypothetical protein